MINQKDNRSVKDLTGRDVFIGDKIVTCFKKMETSVKMHEVVGFSKNGGILIPALNNYNNSRSSSIKSCFVKVESRDDRTSI